MQVNLYQDLTKCQLFLKLLVLHQYYTEDQVFQNIKSKKAIERGHAKINVNTELQQQWTAAVRAKLNADAEVYDPRKVIKPGFDAIVKVTKETMDIFGSTGKA